MEKLIDLSHSIENGMPVYPGDINTNLFQVKYLSENKYNDHRLETSMHAGTHIDSPMHLTENREYISDVPLTPFIGKGCILDVTNRSTIFMKEEYESIVEESSILLLYTGWDEYYGSEKYYYEHPIVDTGFCEFLIEKKIKLLGVDMPSPDKYPFEVHKLLFKNSIKILENLTNLKSLINKKNFEVIALPLKIKADSSLTRAVARIL